MSICSERVFFAKTHLKIKINKIMTNDCGLSYRRTIGYRLMLAVILTAEAKTQITRTRGYICGGDDE